MAEISREWRIYGTATTVWFHVTNPGATAPYTGGFIAGEVKISKEGAAQANTTNLPVHIGAGLYSIALTAIEMQAVDILLTFTNAGGQPTFFPIKTKMEMSQLRMIASPLPGTSVAGVGVEVRGSDAGTGSHAFLTVGTGLGSGLCAIGGATNSHGFFGVGGGTGNGFNGQSNPSSLHPTNFFNAEYLEDFLGVPVVGNTPLSQVISGLAARFYNLVTQTSTQQRVFKQDSVSVAVTASVSDDGVTQTKSRGV